MNFTDLHACLFEQILSFSPLYNINARRKFRSPTIWTAEKAEVGRVREEKRTEEERREEKKQEARSKKTRKEKEPEERRYRCAKR